MSFGQVPVVTAVGSIPNVVEDNTNGIFIRVKNTEDIIDSIIKLATEKNTLEILSSNAQATNLSKFNDNIYINTLNSLYA